MATRNGKSGVQQFVRGQLQGAQRVWGELEGEANKVVKTFLARTKVQRKELVALWGSLEPAQVFDARSVRKLSKKASQTSSQVRKQLDGLQARVVEAAGVASQSQVQQINRELVKLSRKLDALVAKPTRAKPDVQA